MRPPIGDLVSSPAQVTITVADGAYVSSSRLVDVRSTSARYLDLTFPAYVAAGSDVAS